eukprot:2749540-Prymnesium_polylepis.1
MPTRFAVTAADTDWKSYIKDAGLTRYVACTMYPAAAEFCLQSLRVSQTDPRRHVAVTLLSALRPTESQEA